MYVKVEDDGEISKRCDDRDAEALMKHAPEVVLHKVPDELGDIGRGIYNASSLHTTLSTLLFSVGGGGGPPARHI